MSGMKIMFNDVYVSAEGSKWLDSLPDRDRQELIEMVRERIDSLDDPPKYHAMYRIIKDWVEDHGGERTWDVGALYP